MTFSPAGLDGLCSLGLTRGIALAEPMDCFPVQCYSDAAGFAFQCERADMR